MTVEERLGDKLIRHGPESPVVRANPERDDYIRATARRLAHRLAFLERVDAESEDGDQAHRH